MIEKATKKDTKTLPNPKMEKNGIVIHCPNSWNVCEEKK
jgi:hypothetical protein